MAFFTDLKTSLKQKWLQYFQVNRSWIVRQMEVEHVATSDGGRRPSSHLILGVVSVLEPQLVQLLAPFTQLNPQINAIIDVLELDFDPEKVQGFSNPSNFTGNPRSINPDEDIDALMGIAASEEPESQSRSSSVEVVDRTAQGNLQQQSSEQPSASQSQMGDAWLDELNQGKPQSEPTPDNTRATQERRPEDEEISRLFPEF